MENSSVQTAIAPWLTVKDAESATAFYKMAFDAVETYRLETPEGLIARLSVNGAEFWVSGGSANSGQLGGGSIRMILVVSDPDILFAKALKAGALEVFPVGEGHGWKLGRLVDPFGLHWEIGYPLSD
ncbi:MAG TPA: VOC family protein [Chitinophagaceae bacterium]|jgi:PhnB protein|nr:VOC family protein [Chitinophagaceae bacterium]